MSAVDQRMVWNAVSARYQRLHEFSTVDVSYGPWAPPESELQLLGDVAALHILDLGCGGGQNCIALARQGARVTGIDLSEMQIAHARRLAAAESVHVDLVLGSLEELATFDTGATDIVFSSYTFPYVADIARCLEECA
ncbi:MAG: class I SAM-dependent methyltransferase, partial [Caldilinea sp.]|nr:class I SAM-dependent methyltransferase [Caldilinea sp.]